MGRITNQAIEPFDFSNLNNQCVTLKQFESVETPVLTNGAYELIKDNHHLIIEGGFDLVKMGFFGYTILSHVDFTVEKTAVAPVDPVKTGPTEADKRLAQLEGKTIEEIVASKTPVVEEVPIVEEIPVVEEVAVADAPVVENEDIFAKYNSEDEAAFVNGLKTDYNKDELVALCEARGLDVEGTKVELATRIFEWYVVQ